MNSYRYSKILSCALYGISGVNVDIEVSILPGLSSFEIVGLGDCAIRESRDRVHAAIKNNGFEFPNGKITVGMAPGFIRKEGTAFDLPIAAGILAASKQIRKIPDDVCIIGEMSLCGDIKGIPGAINRIITARGAGVKRMIMPLSNLSEGYGINDISLYGVETLAECLELIAKKGEWPLRRCQTEPLVYQRTIGRDISSVIGQPLAVRALSIAAAGMHNIMMVGSPGCGKTTLANVIAGILPDLSSQEMIEVAKIYSSCGLLKNGSQIPIERPFRAPHHNATLTSITGGGHYPTPGEITLAHTGVLFLDEMNEFPVQVLDMLRQPIEEHKIRITRNKYTMEYPADFMLVGAANPCRCGNLLERDNKSPCNCSKISIEKHFSSISGPIMDRMDLYVELLKVPTCDLSKSIRENNENESEKARLKVNNAWDRQLNRCICHDVIPCLNSRLPSEQIYDVFELTDEVTQFAMKACDKLDLSVRGYQKMIRIARTIADYDEEERLEVKHIAQALQFRRK